MKTTIAFIAIFLYYFGYSFAQINPGTPWVWMKGDNTIDQPGIYGTQGVPATANKPGSRVFSTTWKDLNGNLWLFGGNGYSSSSLGYLNDLWKYDPYTNYWTWMKGDNSTAQYSVYGTLGNPAINNKPGATYASVSWTDATGNLWLFGGFGYTNNDYGFLNSLWKYNPVTNQWTWVKGDKAIDRTGVYGTKGTAHNNNKPGARYGSLTWTDASGHLWLFGGYGYDGSSLGMLNDLWKYDPATNRWTWMSGDNSVEQISVYGTKGTPSPLNKPGARYVSTCWNDGNGNLWLFGGYGYDENNSGNLSDLWKFNLATNMWTWVSGDKTINNPGVYGIKGITNPMNKPGSRYVCNSWMDVNGDFWLFGGYGYDANSTGYLNDLWKYNPITNTWTWIKGDSTTDQLAIYGTQGLPDPANKSGARNGSVSWTDGNGNLWLFGGYGYDGTSSGILNDLWKLNNLLVPLPLRLISFNGTEDNNIIKLNWQTADETGIRYFVVQRSLDGVQFSSLGQINSKGGNTKNDYSYLDNGFSGNPPGEVFYRLQIVDAGGRLTYSKVLRFDLRNNDQFVNLYPNPTVNSLQVSVNNDKPGKTILSVSNMSGATVKVQSANLPAGRTAIMLDVSSLAAGVYFLSVDISGNISRHRFIKQ